MDWVKVVYAFVLLACAVYILSVTFFARGDERKKFINRKAQSYTFGVIFGMLILDTGNVIFQTVRGNPASYGQGISPLMFLTIIIVIYMGTLLFYRNEYGN